MFTNTTNTTRRNVIAGIATATTVAIAGCSSSSAGTPKATARQLYEAINANNYDKVVSLLDEELTAETSETQIAEESSRNPEVKEVVVVEKTETEATVNVVIEAETALGEMRNTQQLTMENKNGNWIVTEISSVD